MAWEHGIILQELSYQTSLAEPNAEIYMAKLKVYFEQEQKVKRHKIILPESLCLSGHNL